MDDSFKRWLILGLFLHLTAAVFSTGFYHSDEHFQIVEFMNYKLGWSPAKDLPIEFHRAVRPWLPPALFLGLTQIANGIGIVSPFKLALIFRLTSALLGWICCVMLALCCRRWFSDRRMGDWALIGLTVIWYLPAFHARHSSENWAGALFFIGLAFLALSGRERLTAFRAFGVGLSFGAAFEFRYQVGVMIAGALAWLVFVARVPIRKVLLLLAGLLTVLGLGLLLDRWGYGRWTLTPWNYIQLNFVENYLSIEDTSPWWDFFRRALTETWPPLGLLLLLSFLVAWIRKPRHILTWSTLPLFLLHSIIGHKELRFLFPMAHAGPVLFVITAESLVRIRGGLLSLKIVMAMNLLALISLTFIPAWMPIRFYEKLFSFPHEGRLTIYYREKDPFRVLGIPLNFYRPPQVETMSLGGYPEFQQKIETSIQPLWLFHDRSSLPGEASVLSPYCHKEFGSLPSWIEALNYRGLLNRVSNWTLFRCERNS